MNCPFCGAEVDRSGTCDRCGRVQESTSPTGWRPDPTARHEGRYYAAGHPTNRVRDGRAQSSDPDGGRMLPDYVELPASRSSIRSTWLGTGAATVILVMVAVVAWVLLMAARRPPPPPETGYLSALKEAGLFNQFNSDANAVAHGHQVCRQLEDGGPQQGVPADKIAVDSFCPQFTQGFHMLDTATVSGIFVVTDSAGVDAIASDGASCQGANGYSDVGRDTQVIVKNGKGEILATTALGPGKGDSANCTFSFSFPVTEGQDRYVVSVGHRGEFSYSFGQLRAQGVQIHLGH
ncbi:DUF732 domain-containing protein [Mycolicibacterium brisbanense]|uniref:DUF732 domain-containing protein n=1 Tax=Mycolicibacterium brisbanense TaxID=146020 RepID=A0A100VY22_9MYCO|nr:DUF732 domain-containing protein [Mycolicibacterium brisbanense]MCV7160923.1 DUF732 domain-containing protein [Mycolicibacterium brisbanense]GAS88102.1 protein of unknown function [Mycolicibacterium brisbanense]